MVVVNLCRNYQVQRSHCVGDLLPLDGSPFDVFGANLCSTPIVHVPVRISSASFSSKLMEDGALDS